jgi:flagellar L-ring protein precursor FlgH
VNGTTRGPRRIAVALLAALLWGGAAWGQAISLFSDPKAARVGDALTVIISESATASNTTSTSTEKSNQVEVGSNIPGAGNVLDFIPLHALQSDASNTFEGSAATSRSAQLNARITVTVVDRKPNGDLVIEGVRRLKINGETEAIHLSGAVSPAMIRADNTIPSHSVSDLNIDYTGKGSITQGTRPGLVVRFINWIF